MAEMTNAEFAAGYARAMGDIGRARRHENTRSRCLDCDHTNYLYGCGCQGARCNCAYGRGQKRGTGKLPEPDLPLPVLTAEQAEMFRND